MSVMKKYISHSASLRITTFLLVVCWMWPIHYIAAQYCPVASAGLSRANAQTLERCSDARVYTPKNSLTDAYSTAGPHVDVNGTHNPEVWFRLTVDQPVPLDIKAGYGTGLFSYGWKFVLHLLREEPNGVGYQHLQTAYGRGPSYFPNITLAPGFTTRPPQLTTGLLPGTYYLVVEVSDTLVSYPNYLSSCVDIELRNSYGSAPKLQINPSFARVIAGERIALSASGNVCDIQWFTPAGPTGISGPTYTTAPLSISTTITAIGYNDSGYPLDTATVRLEVEGSNLPHVITRTSRIETTDPAVLAADNPAHSATTATYVNGFGEAVQTVAVRASPAGRDVVTSTEYDEFGRPRRQRLPYTIAHPANAPSADWYRPAAANEQIAFYAAHNDRVATDAAPYSTTWYERTGPDARPTVQAGPGAAWQPTPGTDGASGGHPVRLRYGTNLAGQVRRFTFDFALGRVVVGSPAHYPPGTLALTTSTNENGHPARVFVDVEGREVLREVPLDSLHQTWAATATVFDALGRRRAVLPPLLLAALDRGEPLTAALLDTWAYCYDTDARGRVSETRLPGPVPTTTVYNDRDQPILVGQADGSWQFTKYDALGRVLMTGDYPPGRGRSRADLQAAADAAGTAPELLTERVTGTSADVADDPAAVGTLAYTLDRAWPTDVTEAMVQTRTFYDRSDWAAVRAAGHRFQAEDVAARDLDPADADHPAFTLPAEALTDRTLNLVTATQERVLPAPPAPATPEPGPGGPDPETGPGLPAPAPGAWLTTSTYYDQRLRPVQTLTDLPGPDGAVAGTERTSLSLDWTGRVAQALTRHLYEATTAAPTAWTRYERTSYDPTGRPTRTRHKLSVGQLPRPDDALLDVAAQEYNELGQLVDQRLHSADGGVHWAQSVDYRYHLRGWLTHLNDRHLRPPGLTATTTTTGSGSGNGSGGPAQATGVDPPTDRPGREAADLLGLDLRYGNDGLLGREVGTPADWTGNLTEQHWRTRTGRTDARHRAVAYRYDAAGRLLAAPFRVRLDAGTPEGGRPGRWAAPGEVLAASGERLADYSLSGLSYDHHGNLLTLTRHGHSGLETTAAPARPVVLDRLRLTYAGNRLLAVEDAAPTSPHTPAPDFEDRGHHYHKLTHPAPEYAYDARGNRTGDVARDLTLTYNARNLPARLTDSLGRVLLTTYSATGRKLSERETTPGQPHLTRTTVYAGAAVYEGEAAGLVPAWVAHPQGRLVWRPDPYAPAEANPWRYEYHLRDHLGNLRLAFQPVPLTGSDWASSFEPGDVGQRAASGADSTSRIRLVRAATATHAPRRARTGEHLLVLPGTGSGHAAQRQRGPLVRLPLAAGDSVVASVWGAYDQLLRPARPLVPLRPAADAVPEGATPSGKVKFWPALRLSVAGLLGRGAAAQRTSAAGRAYLRVALYDTDSTLKAERRAYLADSLAPGEWQELAATLGATEDGYAEVSLHDEATDPAYFDDLRVRILEKAVQENHYDPWGFNLVGIESEGTPTHRFQFNGKQKVDALGLHVNDHGARWYDLRDAPVWYQMDPLAEKYPEMSPYVFCLNSPINYSDPDGRDAVFRIRRDGNNDVSSIDVSANVVITGIGASQNYATELNKLARQVFTGAKVNGVNINVSAHFTYKSDATLQSLTDGQNLITMLAEEGRAAVINPRRLEYGDQTLPDKVEMFYGNHALTYSNTRPLAVIHETGHFLGLGDRYFEDGGLPMPGYENDLMGGMKPRLDYRHYQNIYESAVEMNSFWGSGVRQHFPFGSFINRKALDRNRLGGLKRP